MRGRQSLVRNALSGYPQSDEIDKALRWVHWDDSPYVAADDLLRILDGQEPAPGVPALALIAQAVEPMAGMAHREKIADLRHRMRWGAVDPSSFPAANWRDQRPPSELVEERIIGENTLRPLYTYAAPSSRRTQSSGWTGTVNPMPPASWLLRT